MDDTHCLKNRVRELRKRLGLRQADLAGQIGVTRQTILAIEKERLNPSIFISLKIARILREPVDYVFYLAPAVEQAVEPEPSRSEEDRDAYVALEPPKAPSSAREAGALLDVAAQAQDGHDLEVASSTKKTPGGEDQAQPSKKDSDDEPPNQAIWEFV